MQLPTTVGLDIIFEGSKTYWKSRVNLDLVFALHPKQQCIEVIAHHPELGKEARLYLISALLIAKMDQTDLQEKLTMKKEVFIKQKKPVNVAQLTKEVLYSSISSYIQSRLQFTVNEEEGSFTIHMQPMTGDIIIDEASNRMDVVREKPQVLDEVATRFQKKVRYDLIFILFDEDIVYVLSYDSSMDINRALNSLKASSEELKRATNYAELATSSIDGIKLMMAAKLEMERAMRQNCSEARMRWVKAINRVLTMNFVEKVRARLESSPAMSAKPNLAVVTSFGGPVVKRPRILRKSIDNSSLPNASRSGAAGGLPAISKSSSMASSPSQALHHAILPTGSHDSFLPALTGQPGLLVPDGSSKSRRLSRMNNNLPGTVGGDSHKASNRLTRRSLNQDVVMQRYLPETTSLHSSILPSPTSTSSKLTPTTHTNSVPSLRQSYNTMSQKLVQPLSLSAISSDFQEGQGASVHILVKSK